MTRIAFAVLLLTLPVAAQVPVAVPPPALPALPGAPVAAGQNRDTKVQVPIGTASIEGVVVAPDSGRALVGARVSINGNGMPIGRSVLTDQAGRFLFGQLPAGQYSLNASRSRYLSASYGQKAPDRQGTPIRLADGQQMKNITIRLFIGGVITGTVLDERGEPAMNAQVRVSRYMMRAGARQLQQSGQNSTDDRGIYRFHGLVPGEYIVSATLSQNGSPQADAAAAAVERAIAAGARASATTTMQISTGTVPAITIDNAFGVDFGGPAMMAATYYPGTTTAATATSVRLAAGEERSGVDFQVQIAPTVTVQGIVINPAGPLPPGLNVQMTNDDAEAGAFSTGGRVDAEGRFTFRNVPPGQYMLTARAQPVGAPPAMAAMPGLPPAATPQAAPAKPLYGRTVITVGDTPVNGIAVTLDPGRTVSGRVVFDGAIKPPDLTKTRLSASMQAAPGTNLNMPTSSAVVGQDGRFSITGVQPGRYVLRVSSAQGWYLRSSNVNGQETLDLPVEVAGQDVQNAVVTFVDRTTELSGLLQDPQGQPATDYTIVVFSVEERFWPGSTRRVTTTRPATDGRYTVNNLPPGDYYIAALTDIEPGASSDPQFLRMLISAAARITLNDGDKKTQDLRVGR